MAMAMEPTYSTPEKDEYDTKPLPHILKNSNFRNLGEKEKEDINMVNAELAGLKLLLHDAIKASAHNENLRKKFDKKIRCLIFITLLLTNMLSIMSTGSITYFVITQDRVQTGLQSGLYGQSEALEKSGIGFIPTLHMGTEPVEKPVEKFEGMMAGGGDSAAAGDTGVTGITGISAIRGRLTNKSTQSSQLQLGSIWN